MVHASSPTTNIASASVYRVRRREAATVEGQQTHRDLLDFVPSFSADDESLVEVQMPALTLLLQGLGGQPLGDKSYDALQTAMNDYMRKRFEEYFAPRYVFTAVRNEVVGDSAYENSNGRGNAVSMETSLTFRDPDYVPRQSKTYNTEPEIGAKQRVYLEPNFRASDVIEKISPQARTTAVVAPSALELEFAAGYAWNDLSSFRNHLLVAAAIEDLQTFDDLEAIDPMEDFPDSAEEEELIAVVEQEIEAETEETESPAIQETESPDVQAQPVTAPPGNTLSVSAAQASQFKQSGTDRLNPLWPALIVGLGVFLFTIIVLGYRKQKSRGNDPFFFGSDRSYRGTSKPDQVLVHIVNDNSTLEGDEEIEVEDQFYSTPSSTPDRQQQRKKKERDLDKEYATSCLGPVAKGLALSPSPPPSTSDDASDPEEYETDFAEKEVERSKNCLKGMSTRRKSKDDILQDLDSMALESNNSRGIDLPRRVDLTTRPDQSSWRNPARLHEESDDENDGGDLTKKEKKKFTNYMEAGLTIEEASHQVLSERTANRKNSNSNSNSLPVAPSATSRTRSGGVQGYSVPSNRGQKTRQVDSCGERSNPLACLDTSQVLHEEMMEDGTAVHYINRNESPLHLSLGAACMANDPSLLQGIDDRTSARSSSRGERIDGTARPMVITAASSYASSYDDDDYVIESAMA